MSQVPKPIASPVYVQDRLNQEIDLGAREISLLADGISEIVQARAIMVFEPDDNVEFRIPFSALSEALRHRVEGGKTPTAAFHGETLLLLNASPTEGLTFAPGSLPVATLADTPQLQHVTFHLLNFPPFRRSVDRICEPSSFHMTLRVGDWRVTVSEVERASSLRQQMGIREGLAITHAGCIEKSDGAMFASREVFHILGDLSRFFSFIAAKNTEVFLPVGCNQEGQQIWEELGLSVEDSPHLAGELSLLTEEGTETVIEVFPGFIGLLNDRLWRMTICNALDWYTQASLPGVYLQTAIVLGQIALELLAWTYCVEDRKMISREGFRKLNASDKLRILYSGLGIPACIPRDMEWLVRWAKINRISDTPQVLTEVRNSIVHPIRRNTSEDYCALYEDCRYLAVLVLKAAFVALARQFKPSPARVFDWDELRRKSSRRPKP